MTDYNLLKYTAERMQAELEQKRDTEWNGATDYGRLVYRIERLKEFQEYIRMTKTYRPPHPPNDG